MEAIDEAMEVQVSFALVHSSGRLCYVRQLARGDPNLEQAVYIIGLSGSDIPTQSHSQELIAKLEELTEAVLSRGVVPCGPYCAP